VKGRVEAGDLREVRITSAEGFDQTDL
jgi:hypothetical protein